MKAVGVGLILVLAAVLPALPVAASCAVTMADTSISSANGTDPAYRSFIWSRSVFEPFYFESYLPVAYEPPFTPVLKATFWSLGEGDPAFGIGNDSGIRNLVGQDLTFGYPPYPPNNPYDVFYAAQLSSDWTLPDIDGCNDMSTCTCLLLSDVDPQERHGLFALVGAATDTLNGTFFNLTGSDQLGNGLPIVLQEIPRPVVTGVVRPLADTVEITLTVPTRSGGVYEAASGAGCFCGPTEFLIRGQVLPRGSVPPVGRSLSSWPVAALAGGGAQPATPTDGSVTVEATCPAGDADVYLVTDLFFDSGFSSAFVSGNSIPVECGGNLSGEFLLDVRTSSQLPRPSGKNR
jgi:hypothetical protein